MIRCNYSTAAFFDKKEEEEEETEEEEEEEEEEEGNDRTRRCFTKIDKDPIKVERQFEILIGTS